MHGELFALFIVVLGLAAAAYSGFAARTKPRDKSPDRLRPLSAEPATGSKPPVAGLGDRVDQTAMASRGGEVIGDVHGPHGRRESHSTPRLRTQRPNLLIISPADHYALRNLEPLREISDMNIGNEQAELEKLAANAEVILFCGPSHGAVDFREIFRRAQSLRWIQSTSAGIENLLFPELIASDVEVTNARGVYKRPLAEFAMLGILFHTKRVRRLIDNQRKRAWDDFTVSFANDLVMGVVGYGEIGRECALLAKGLGLKVHALRRNPERSAHDELLDRIFGPAELHDMLSQIDVLLCSAPLTPQTHHLIGDAEFACMKPGAIVINVGRGPVIDEAALVRALQAGRIAGASLDVFEHEPLPESSPLWDMDNVLISPHCTDRTIDPDWLDLSMRFFVANFQRYVNGEPLDNVVDKTAGY